jgi:prepilin-type N-terminal cleavage/methylation domain-containing protein
MKRGFTIVELLVAMGLFGALLAASGIIFAAAVDAHRTAEATAEIARKLAAITDQLNADFMGLQKDYPMVIWFEVDPCDPCNPDVRHDQILFFADGDFQSYGYSPPLVGNTARVYYGQANIMDVDYQSDPLIRNPVAEGGYDQVNILARRQHIYSPDLGLGPFPTDPCDSAGWLASFDIAQPQNDLYEHDNISLSQWKTITNDPCYNNQIITTCFDNTEGRAGIDLDNAETLHMVMAQGVGHFEIQLSYFTPQNRLQWFPSTDPDGDPCTPDSDFGPSWMNKIEFGVYFNMPGGVDVPPGESDWLDSNMFFLGFFPEALKFTFTLYDSRGVFPEGKTFTHIVYLDD